MQLEHPALILIDMQQCMASLDAGDRNNPGAEANIAALLAAWRARAAPVVHVRHISRHPTSGFAPGQPGAAFQPAFLPLAGEHVVEKNVPDAFVASGLERWLRYVGSGGWSLWGSVRIFRSSAVCAVRGIWGSIRPWLRMPALPLRGAITRAWRAVPTRCMRWRCRTWMASMPGS